MEAKEQKSASPFLFPPADPILFRNRQLIRILDAHSNFPIFQDSAGHLRVRVHEGEVITRTLRPGEMNYLTAIEEIQDRKLDGKTIDEESVALFVAHCSMIPSNIEINPLDPWLYEKATGVTEEEQREFYFNVWILFNHLDHEVEVKAGQACKLKRVKPDFIRLQVALFSGQEGNDQLCILQKHQKRGLHYTLTRNSGSRIDGKSPTQGLLDRLRYLYMIFLNHQRRNYKEWLVAHMGQGLPFEHRSQRRLSPSKSRQCCSDKQADGIYPAPMSGISQQVRDIAISKLSLKSS